MEGGGGSNNQGPAQGAAANVNVAPAAAAAGDWRVQLPPGARDRIVNKILDTLQRHLPICEKEGLDELRRIAERFEEKIYNIAGNQSDYLRRISLKMLTMETHYTRVISQTYSDRTRQDPSEQVMEATTSGRSLDS